MAAKIKGFVTAHKAAQAEFAKKAPKKKGKK
jgi:hypothetical protein